MKQETIQIRVNKAQKYSIQKLADKFNLSVTELIIVCINYMHSRDYSDFLNEWYRGNMEIVESMGGDVGTT